PCRLAEPAKLFRHIPTRQRVQKCHSHPSGVGISQRVDPFDGGLHLGDAASGVLEHDAPVRVQAQPPVDAVEQRRAYLRFESPQGARQRRLADAQLRGGLGDVLDLSECDEPLQFLEVHTLTITKLHEVDRGLVSDASRILAGSRKESSDMSTWLITGCSTGLGRSLADAVIGAGHNAVVAARDVTKPEQVASAVQQAQERFGGVDVLVNNAGYGYRAAVEEGDDVDVRTLFETHFFGTVAMIKAVLPGMRARRSGAIVNISSIGAQLTPVGSGYYAA